MISSPTRMRLHWRERYVHPRCGEEQLDVCIAVRGVGVAGAACAGVSDIRAKTCCESALDDNAALLGDGWQCAVQTWLCGHSLAPGRKYSSHPCPCCAA